MLGINSEKLFKAIPFTQACIAIHGKEKAIKYCRNDRFDWHTEIANAFIWAGFSAFSYFTVEGLDNISDMTVGFKAGLIAGGFAFFIRMASKRKLFKKIGR